MKKILAVLLTAILMLAALSGCGSGEQAADSSDKKSDVTEISLSDEGSTVEGGGAAVKENGVRISAGGSYRISGKLSQGIISVNTADSSADVIIILDNADISNPQGPAIHIEQAANTRIQLAEGSANRLSSGNEGNAFDENASGAVILSEDDLDLEGEGSLIIEGNINNGIGCKDDLDINSGSYEIHALNNGIRASESVEIKGGLITLSSGNDGIKTSSAKKADKGFVKISGGEISVLSTGDAVSAETELIIEGGKLNANAEGSPEDTSSRALKAKGGISISGGEINAVSVNDRGLSSEGDINISGGSLSITSADDGIKTLGNVNHSGGEINIISSADGIQAGDKTLEAARRLSISGGEIHISACKNAVNTDELEIKGGKLLALQNEEGRGGWEYLGGQSLAAGDFEAYKESEVSFEGMSMISGNACKKLFASAPELEAGKEYTASNGIDEFIITAE